MHETLALVNDGVTAMVAVTGEAVLLVAVKAEIFPAPLGPSPMEVFELTQLYTVPGTVPEKATAAVEFRWHKTWFAVPLTVGSGFTMMENEVADPVHVCPENV